jgi:hypothetical protein
VSREHDFSNFVYAKGGSAMHVPSAQRRIAEMEQCIGFADVFVGTVDCRIDGDGSSLLQIFFGSRRNNVALLGSIVFLSWIFELTAWNLHGPLGT